MGALLDQYTEAGLRVEAGADGKLRVTGQLTDALRASIRTNKPALLAELAANAERYAQGRARLWRIRYPNVASIDVLFTPDSSAEEVREAYPGADIGAIPEVTKRKPTAAEDVELRTLMAEVLGDDSQAEREEALARIFHRRALRPVEWCYEPERRRG